MRVIISNDLKRLYGNIDYSILEKTQLNKSYALGSSGITVINPSGFSANDYICIGEPGTDHAEILQISSISGLTINLTTVLVQNYEKRDSVYRLAYNQIKFYESDIAVATVNIKPDFWVESARTIDTTLYYHMTFYNSTSAVETAAGEKIKGYNRLLCSVADVYQLESACALSTKILDKIEIATREILSLFINQGGDISELTNFNVLKIPCACLALKYYWMEQVKNKDDVSSIKLDQYTELYKAKIIEASSTINMQETNVSLWGQTRIDR